MTVVKAGVCVYRCEYMGESPAPSRRVAVDAIVLAFRHSALRDTSDALRSVVDASYGDMLSDEGLDLEVLWELLEDQPDFDPEKAKKPLCVIKSWEDKLGLPVCLPQALSDLSDTDVALVAQKAKVPATEVQRAFESAEEKAERLSRAREAVEVAVTTTGVRNKHLELAWYERKEAAVGAGVALVLSLGVIIFTLFGGRDGGWEPVDPTEFASDIPIDSAQQLGKQVGGQLTDPGWLDGPEDKRRASMKSALVNLQSRDVEVFYIQDQAGQVRATAQWYGDPPDVKIVFR